MKDLQVFVKKWVFVFFMLMSFSASSSYALSLNFISPAEEAWAAIQADQFCKDLKSQPVSQMEAGIDMLQKPGLSIADGQRLLETVSLNPLDQNSMNQLFLQKGLTHSTYVLVNSNLARLRINACQIPGLDPTALFYFRIYRNEVQARVLGFVGLGAVFYGMSRIFHKGWLMLEKGADRFDLLRWVVVLSPWLGRQLFKVFFGYVAYEIGVNTCEGFRSLTESEKVQLKEMSKEAFSDTDDLIQKSYQFLLEGKRKRLQFLIQTGQNPPLQQKLQRDIQKYEEKIRDLTKIHKMDLPEQTRTGVSLYLQYFCDDLTAFANKVRMSEK
jgi:hypothetical protein